MKTYTEQGNSMSQHATLPENRERPRVSDLAIGEAAYIVRLGMWVDEEQRCWLHPDFTVTRSAVGTSDLRIERRADGYHVWTPVVARWTPVDKPSYTGSGDTTYIPVVEFHDDHRALVAPEALAEIEQLIKPYLNRWGGSDVGALARSIRSTLELTRHG